MVNNYLFIKGFELNFLFVVCIIINDCIVSILDLVGIIIGNCLKNVVSVMREVEI